MIAAGGLAVRSDIARVRAQRRGRRDARHALRGHGRERCARGVQGGARGGRGPTTALTICFDGRMAARAAPRAAQPPRSALGGGGLSRSGPASRRGTRHRPWRAGAAIPRYDDAPPLAGDSGAIGEMCLYAGAGCAAIGDVPTAAELVERLTA